MRGVVCFFLAACAPAAVQPAPPSHEVAEIAAVTEPVESTIPAAPHTPMPALLLPKVAAEPQPKPEGHLAHPVCIGPINLKKDRPRKASCCYPAKDLIVAPIRAAYPALRACFDNRKNKDAEGRVVFVFRVEQDGSIPRVCSGEPTTLDDADAVRCMVEEIRKVRYPAMSDFDRDFCGLFSFNYPVTFEP